MLAMHTSRTVAGLALVASIATTTGVQQVAAAAPDSATTASTTRVIVVLRHGAPSTSRAVDVLGRLSGPTPRHLVNLSLADAFAASVDSAQAVALAADPDVAFVAPDALVPLTTSTAATAAAVSPSGQSLTTSAATEPPFAICPSDPSQPLSEPEALNSIHALTTDGTAQAQDLSTGSGVKVAFLGDGIDPDEADFIRPGGQHVIADYKDFSGDGPAAPSAGTQAFGAASSIAAQGTVSHDLSLFVNQAHPLPPGCNIKVTGVAPGASLYALKVGNGYASTSSILQAIDYAVRVKHVNVIDEPFALTDFPDDSSRNAVKLANDNAVTSGVTVIVAGGDAGLTGPLGAAAADAHVISVGATTDNQFAAQTTAAAQPFSNGHWVSDNISPISSAATSQHGRTVDLVAPGDTNWAECEPGFSGCTNFRSPPGPSDLQAFAGTEESAALTAGTAALVIAAYRSTHAGKRPTPAVVKQILTGTATDLTVPTAEQGAGLLNARAATEAALTWPGATTSAPTSVKSNIVTSRNQMTLAGAGGTAHSGVVTVTNVGNKKLTIAAASRRFSQAATQGQATAFDSNTLPTFTYYDGTTWAFKVLHFHVDTGTSRLLARSAWAGSADANAIVRMTLLAPDGTFATSSQPQGGALASDYATVDVRSPAAGTWSAVLYSPSGSAGYTGVVGLDTDQFRAVPVGTVAPATFTLSPGKSRDVTFRVTLPTTAAGDQDDALTIASSNGHQTSVGVVVRTLIDPATKGHAGYSGVLTGGNGQPSAAAETFSYGIIVPDNRPALSVSLTFAQDPGSLVDLVLLAPDGQVADITSNQPVSAGGSSYDSSIQSYTASPVAGRWTLVVVAHNPVSGTAFEDEFTGKVAFHTLTVDRGTLPNATTTHLKRGVAKSYDLTVTNTGVQAILVGVDARTNSYVTMQPVPIRGQSTFTLPGDASVAPAYTVPPDTKSFTVSASSSVPAQLELVGPGGGVHAVGSLSAAQQGSTISIAKTSESGANFIARGAWSTAMQEIGPFTDAGESPGQTTLTASMSTRGFDSTITSTTGDPYGGAFDPAKGGPGTPIVIPAGESATITIHLTPRAKVGSAVSGILNLVTVPELPAGTNGLPLLSTGEVVAVIPYSYTVA
jgi:hypothetical protein